MGSEDEARNARRDALLAMHAQTGEAQKPPSARPPVPVQQPSSVLQMTPIIRDANQEADRKATVVLNKTWEVFQKMLG